MGATDTRVLFAVLVTTPGGRIGALETDVAIVFVANGSFGRFEVFVVARSKSAVSSGCSNAFSAVSNRSRADLGRTDFGS